MLLLALTSTSLRAQTAPAPSEVHDLPLSPEQARRFAGRYAVAMRGAGAPPTTFRFFEHEEGLMGQIEQNDPTRMLYQGGAAFRPEDAPVFVVTFVGDGAHPSHLTVESPEGTMEGVRMADASATSGPLFDTLARLDSLLFMSAFVTCDTEQRNALFTDDVEFYHDKSGFMAADAVRAPIETCPRDNGISRHLVAGSLEVYPLHDYGAIQMGTHRFVETGASTQTIAKFVHLWHQQDGVWKIARVLSFDHQSIPAPTEE